MKRKRDSPDAAATTSDCVDHGDPSSGAEFEVFLSFRGPDTRLGFTDCLYHSMVGAGIRVFRDDEEIRKGEKIGGELLHAIESSKIFVPIFSRNYASSVWCLRELKQMVECSGKADDKVILPIFYDVNPDDVKLKTPLYLDALKKHEEKFGRDDVREWEEALTEVARIKGWGGKNRGHGEIINAIKDDVLTKLKKRTRNLPDHLVGIHDHVEAIMDLLNKGSPDVCYLVIHGMGGIETNRLWMHDQVRDLGREIVRSQDVNVPGNRSRLWLPKTALDVIQMKEGTNKVIALKLTGLSKMHNFTSEEFSKLPNLKFLELEGGNMVGDFKNLLSKLIWLSWSDCPSELNAKNLCLKKLAVLKLSGSNITENWAGWEPCLVSENLKVIQITSCESLKRTPDFSKCLNLKRLVVAGCTTSLVVAGSLSKLEHLKYLEIMSRGDQLRENCDLFVVPFVLSSPKSLSTLKIDTMPILELHQSIEEMKGLNYLSTISCRIPRTLPDFIGKLNSLLVLKLENIEITELPSSIGNLKRLEILYLDKIAIRELPRAIGMLENLKELTARFCQNVERDIPSEIGGLSFLRMLDLRGSKIRRLPITMNQLSHLQQLCLDFCYEFEQFPELPKSLKVLSFAPHLLWNALDLSYLTNLVNLYIDHEAPQLLKFRHGAPKIKWIEGLSNLESLTLIMRDVTFPLINLATLSRLRNLEITCVGYRSVVGLPSSLKELYLIRAKSPTEMSLSSDWTNQCNFVREVVSDGVLGQQLVNVGGLEVSNNELLERLHVSRLTGLQRMLVDICLEASGDSRCGDSGTAMVIEYSSMQLLGKVA